MQLIKDGTWRQVIDTVLEDLCDTGVSTGAAETIFVTGSYARGVVNLEGPNLNVYFIAAVGEADRLRAALAMTFAALRVALRERGIELLIDCHPFTLSIQNVEWSLAPTLTLTTKVFETERANESLRLGVSPTIGYGWWATHKVLLGSPDALEFLKTPPPRDEQWFAGASSALLAYRNMIDHLPWAMDVASMPRLFVREVTRYAEETIKDGVHFGATDNEVATGAVLQVLHNWDAQAPNYFADRYGPDGHAAVMTVQQLKSQQYSAGNAQTDPMEAWRSALSVWSVVWEKFVQLSASYQMPRSTWTLRTWM